MPFPLFHRAMFVAEDIYDAATNRNKACIVIMRGMYGSGKTTFANEVSYILARWNLRTEICSADQFMYELDGKYVWTTAQLHNAHTRCRLRYEAANDFGYDCIIVDNTNLRASDFKDYMADKPDNEEHAAFELFFVTFDCPNLTTAVELAKRCRHPIPNEVVVRNYDIFVETNVAFQRGDFHGQITNLDTDVEVEQDLEQEEALRRAHGYRKRWFQP